MTIPKVDIMVAVHRVKPGSEGVETDICIMPH